MRYAFLLIPLAALLAIACGGDGSTPMPSPTPSPAVVLPSPTPEPTAIATLAATPDAAPPRIFFRRENELWSIDLDGSDPLLLSGEVSGRSAERPLSSPQHNKIAFVGTDGNLWIVDSNGKNLRRLSEEALPTDDTYSGTNVFVSGWSPSGTKILYSVEPVVGLGVEGKERPEVGLYLFDLDTGERRRIPDLPKTDELNPPKVVQFIPWPLDSEAVIYEQQERNEQTGESYIEWHTMDLETGSTSKLTAVPFECTGLEASVSSDGDTLIYSCGDLNTPDPGTSKIVIANVDNTDQRVLLEGIWAELQSPLVSPTGDGFVYRHHLRQPDGSLYVEVEFVALGTGQQTQLANGCAWPTEWVEDHSVLILESETCFAGEASTLYVVEVGSGARTILAEDVAFE